MATPYNSVKEQREAVPISSHVTTSSPTGALFVMNVFIQSDKLDVYVEMVTPVVHRIRGYPECEMCEISTHPEDKGHVRIVQVWNKDSAWFRENIETSPWFGQYIKELAPLRDTKRPRIIEHFDRIIV